MRIFSFRTLRIFFVFFFNHLIVLSQSKLDTNGLKYYSHLIIPTKGEINSESAKFNATCFIVTEKGKYFLVTNYHVLTGREPFTGRQVLPQPDTIQVVFYTNNGAGYNIQKFPLYKNGKPMFYTISKNFDVAVFPIKIDSFCNFVKQVISSSELDVRKSIAPGNQLLIIGFPVNCQTNNVFSACTYSTISISPLRFKPYSAMLFFDIVIGKGSSGSPIYVLDKSKKEIKVIGINSMRNIMDIDHSSAGLYSYCVRQIINKITK